MQLHTLFTVSCAIAALAPLPTASVGLGTSSQRAWLDVDGDGALDLFVANSAGPETLFLRREGVLVDMTASVGLAGAELSLAAWEDFDGDGDLDLLAMRDGTSSLFEFENDQFIEINGAAGLAHSGIDLDAAWRDFNSDGMPDLEIAQHGRFLLFANRGDGTFGVEEVSVPIEPASRIAPHPGASAGVEPDSSLVAEAPTATAPIRPSRVSAPDRVGSNAPRTGTFGASNGTAGQPTASTPSAKRSKPLPSPALITCATSLLDLATGLCVAASSEPLIGHLYPLSNDFFVTKGGDVGIGTTVPSADLHVRDGEATLILQGTNSSSEVRSELRLATTSANTGFRFSNTGTRLEVATVNGIFGPHMTMFGGTGHMGINEPNPQARVHIFDELFAPQVIVSGGANSAQLVIAADDDNSGEFHHPSIRMTQDGGAVAATVGFRNGTNDVSVANEFGAASLIVGSDGDVHVKADALSVPTLTLAPNVHGGGQFITLDTDGVPHTALDTDTVGGGGRLRIWDGINSSPAVLLEALEGSTGSNLEMRNDSGTVSFLVDSEFTNGGGCRVEVRDSTGDDKIAMDGQTGRVRVSSLAVTGGSDIAEPFDIAGDVAPGVLVAIDPDNPGGLRVCTEPYDGGVVGIVSGAAGIQPGLTLTQDGTIADGEHPVALSGRVWCRADSSNGEIEPGDLLTSSELDGHAMRATDTSRGFGTVVGKAMTRIDVETGLVLVWVNLQ